MMASVLSTTTDVFPSWKPFPTYKQSARSREALDFFRKCTNFKHLTQIHAKIIRGGLSNDQTLITNLLRLCSSYNKMDHATSVFSQMQNPSTFAWNIMIRGHVLTNNSHDALLLYHLMMLHGIPIDKFTIPFVIKACNTSSAIRMGHAIHVLVIKNGLSGDIFIQNTLMDLYFKCGDPKDGCKVFDKMGLKSVVSWTTMLSGLIAHEQVDAARIVFEEMPFKNVISWTAMINGYAGNGEIQEAFKLFQRMRFENVRPNEYTLVGLLISCTKVGSLKMGNWIHDYSRRNNFEIGPHLGTALIDMYSKCGSLENAQNVFDKMQVKTLATWNSMITSLGVHGCGEKALNLFSQMNKEGIQPDAITFVGVLCACVRMRKVDEGAKYFKCMQETYGIKPLPEHHVCMIELSEGAS